MEKPGGFCLPVFPPFDVQGVHLQAEETGILHHSRVAHLLVGRKVEIRRIMVWTVAVVFANNS